MDDMKKLLAGLIAIVAGVFYVTHSHAAAPQLKGQAPGYYRMMLGDFEIVALSDGTLEMPVTKLMTNTTPARVEQMLKRSFLADPVELSVNGYLVNTGSKLVLIDTGAGSLFGPTLGSLIANLKAAGYQPEQVDEIYITHLHGDHVGGVMAGDKLAFPNAIVRVDKRDAEFWLSQATMDGAAQDQKVYFKGAMMSVNPYAAAGRFKPFDGSGELVPGISAVAAYGHTKGHTMFIVESKGQKLVVVGDLMHVAAVQFPQPSATVSFDTDSKMAAMQRKKLYADAAKRGYWLAAAHVSFPGIGHLRSEGSGYVFVPVNYGIVR